MAWYSSRTGAVIAALVIVVCASPAAQAQEWVLWRNTPSLRDQDPAKRLPPLQRADTPAPDQAQGRAAAPVATVTQPGRTAAPAITRAVAAPTPAAIAVSTQVATPAPSAQTVAKATVVRPAAVPTPAPKPASSADAVLPAPTASGTPPSAATVTASAPDLQPAASSAPAATSAAPVSQAAPMSFAEAATARPAALPSAAVPAPKRGTPAITMPAHSTADTEAVAIAPLDDRAGIAAPAASGGVVAAASATLARAEPVSRPQRASGAYVTVGSESDASLVTAAPQVYSCDESGRCEHLENERPNVGLHAAPAPEDSPHRQIESEIKRSALRGF